MIQQHELPGGRLCRFKPLFRGREREVRYLTAERADIYQWLYDETGSDDDLRARGFARGHFGQFVKGMEIDDLYFIKRVEDRRRAPWSMEHGIWALSPRFEPQHRFFGCFATYNWFVALSKESRDVLEEHEDRWHEQIDKCLGRWDDLFPGKLIFLRPTLEEFVSNAEKLDDRW
jgi:hypothetical protein